MKLSCEIVRDLLPLYHDGVCSEASAAAVREHLDGCARCQKELERMDGSLAAPPAAPTEDTAVRAAKNAWSKARRRAFRKGLGIAGGIVLFIALLLACFPVYKMLGHSMEPTIRAEEHCLFSRLPATPARGDIVAATPEFMQKYDIVDIVRVAAVPGDTVEVRNGAVYVNGAPSQWFSAGIYDPGDIEYPITLGENEYFVMGDNGDNSFDSRFSLYGLLRTKDIRGRLICVLPSPFASSSSAAIEAAAVS